MKFRRVPLIAIILMVSTTALGAEYADAPARSATIVTANITLQRGHIIGSGDISILPQDAQNIDGVLNRYIGQQMRRTVHAGAKINLSHVDRPILVKRNSRVDMVYRIGRLEMTVTGRALGQGGEGEVISVMNLGSKRRVQGYILPNGNIAVVK